MTQVLFDARLAVRGLGIASATDRLSTALSAIGDVQVTVNASRRGWTRRGQFETVLRSGCLDLSPRLDVRTWGVDVVHYFGNTAPQFADPRTVVTVHDLMMLRSTSRRSAVFERLLVPGLVRGGARIVAISSRTADSLRTELGIPLTSIEVIPHGRRLRTTWTGDRPYLLMFGGSSDPRKRVGLGLAAYSRYAEAAGDEALPLMVAARSGVAPADLSQAVHGQVNLVADPSDADLGEMIRRAACLIYPSRWEGYGLPIVEAGEVGTPVVIDAHAIIAQEALGLHVTTVNGGSTEDWAEAIVRSIRLGNVPNALPSLPTWDQVAQRYAEVYRTVRQ